MAKSRDDAAAFLTLAKERFQQGQEASQKQRQRELDDLAFYGGGDRQWEAEALRTRKGHGSDTIAGLPPLPPRPTITINKVREPVHQVLNQERQSDMGIALVPADDFGELGPPIDETEIELREGLTRRIQRESEAADARTWAFARATIAGTGAYRVLTRYVPGKTTDKEVYVARIFNQASVTWDPAHEQPDGSDAEWVFIGTDMPWEKYKAEFPRVGKDPNRLTKSDDAAFRALGEECPGWFKQTGETKTARVVEYFYVEREARTVAHLADGTAVWKDEVPEDVEIVDEHEDITKRVHWAKIDGVQVLEETEWEGPDIPVIKVLGEELQPFDAERRAEGMVRPARDANQGFNAMVSKWVELIGLTPMSSLMLAEGQWEGYQTWYQYANTRTLPFLPYRRYDESGKDLGVPSAVDRNAPIQALAASVQLFDEAIKSTTMVPSVQLGQQTDARLKSGKAIQLLQDQAQLGTSNYLDNLKRSIRYEGQIINNLLYPIYGTRPGRLARMVTGENEPQTVRIGQPLGNQPQMAGAYPSAGNGGQPPMGGVGAGQSSTPPKTYTLTPHANFNVIVKVTRSFDSRRQEESTTIGNLLQADPAQMAIYGDLFFKNQDGPGHEEMADRARVMLAPPIQQYLAQKEQGGQPAPPDPEKQQLQQKLQHAEQILQSAKQELEGKHAEQEAKIKIEQLITERMIKLQEMKDAAAFRVAELGAKKDTIAATYEDAEEAIALGQQQRHEATQAELDRQHELDKAQLGHQHALEAGAQPPPVDPNRPPPQTGPTP